MPITSYAPQPCSGRPQSKRLRHVTCPIRLQTQRKQGSNCYNLRRIVVRASRVHHPAAKRANKNSKRSLHKTSRGLAVLHLLRIEQDKAYSALVAKQASDSHAIDSSSSGSPADHPESDAEVTNNVESTINALDDSLQTLSSGNYQHSTRETTWLVAGVTRWRRRLDCAISNVSARSVDTMDPPVRQILRIGTYEIVHGDMASHAANEHVELCRVCGNASATSLVNAVLRAILRHRDSGTLNEILPEVPEAPVDTFESLSRQDRKQYVRALALAMSHPTWLMARWLPRLGHTETVQLCGANNCSTPQFSLRLNRARTNAHEVLERLNVAGVQAHASELLPDDIVCVSRGLQTALRSGLLEEGHAVVQDEAAALVVTAALAPQRGDVILDTCAAPGGKALFAASSMHGAQFSSKRETESEGEKSQSRSSNRSIVVAMDLSRSKVGLLQKAAETWGLEDMFLIGACDLLTKTSSEGFEPWKCGLRSSVNSAVLDTLISRSDHSGSPPCTNSSKNSVKSSQQASADTEADSSMAADIMHHAEDIQQPPGAVLFDKVLLDAPCTGTGVLCKKPDMRWQRTAQDMQELVQLQHKLLAAAVCCVRPGGHLVYSTCSLEWEENQGQIEWLLEQYPGCLEVEPISRTWWQQQVPGDVTAPSASSPSEDIRSTVITSEGFLQCMPHMHGCDGAFAARVRVVERVQAE